MIVTFQTGELSQVQCLLIWYFLGTFCELDAGIEKVSVLKTSTTPFFEWPKRSYRLSH